MEKDNKGGDQTGKSPISMNELQSRQSSKERSMTKLIQIAVVGLLALVIAFVISSCKQLSPQQVSWTKMPVAATKRAKQNASATVEACETRQTRKWCASRQKWATDLESKTSALLKTIGGREALTSREQTQLDDIERQLALYRRTCEASETSLGALLEEIDLLLQSSSADSRRLNRELIGYMSSC